MSEDSSANKSDDYQVLARKYRPISFDGLIGQDALVRTLTNAINTGRLAHAFILTGVRGIGKTTSARIIARAFNCIGVDGKGGPTPNPCGVCVHCKDIAEDRHVDVLEMDAASRTGVDDIRELIESVRYRPTSARNKIYIIDEVHMLSKNAFNALLKTLEEPPEHVKFIFATTEIRKVPVTVLSRCQRFDLRRVEVDVLTSHFATIAEKEGAKITDGAMALIARAADGSVRDGLSLLDQAIAHTDGEATEDQVRNMLGLADRTITFDLMDALMKGEIAEALEVLAKQYEAGADPVAVIGDLLELSHWLTRVKVAPESANDPLTPEAERVRGGDMAGCLSMATLARVWQMLLKGLGEARIAPRPLQAVEMILVRLAYASGLPTPEEAIKSLKSDDKPSAAPVATVASAPPPSPPSPPPSPPPEPVAAVAGGAAPAPEPLPEPEPVPEPDPVSAPEAHQSVPDPASFDEVVALAGEVGEIILQANLRNNVHLVHFEPGRIEFHLAEDDGGNTPFKLRELLNNNTSRQWMVTVNTDAAGDLTLRQKEDEAAAKIKIQAAQDPLIKEILKTFPGAHIEDVQEIETERQTAQTRAHRRRQKTTDHRKCIDR